MYWCCIMITITQTSRGLLSGKKTGHASVKSEQSLRLISSVVTVIYLFFAQLVSCHFRKHVLLVFSLGVALSRGHGKFFFRGNVTVEEGRKASIFLLCFTHFYFFIVFVSHFVTQLTRLYSAAMVKVFY